MPSLNGIGAFFTRYFGNPWSSQVTSGQLCNYAGANGAVSLITGGTSDTFSTITNVASIACLVSSFATPGGWVFLAGRALLPILGGLGLFNALKSGISALFNIGSLPSAIGSLLTLNFSEFFSDPFISNTLGCLTNALMLPLGRAAGLSGAWKALTNRQIGVGGFLGRATRHLYGRESLSAMNGLYRRGSGYVSQVGERARTVADGFTSAQPQLAGGLGI